MTSLTTRTCGLMIAALASVAVATEFAAPAAYGAESGPRQITQTQPSVESRVRASAALDRSERPR